MDNTGPETIADAQAKTESYHELFAGLYAQDSDLVRLHELWSDLSVRDKQAFVRLAERFTLERRVTR